MAVENGRMKIVSLNSQGLKNNLVYVQKLIETHEVTFVCEHWLSNAECSVIKDGLPAHHNLHFSPAEKQPRGRPYGGNCFIVNEAVVGRSVIIHEDPNFLGIKITKNDVTYIIVGCYLTSYHDVTSMEKYRQQLDILSGLVKLYRDESQNNLTWGSANFS